MPEPNVFAGASLDRAGPHRGDEEWVAARLADPAARVLVATRDGVFLDEDGTPAGVAAPAALGLAGAPRPILLGLAAGGDPWFALDADGVEPEALGALAPAVLTGVRDAAATLRAEDAGLLAYASAMLNWHRRHGFCANCGAPTEVGDAGFVRRCPRCGAQHHPRTDPVVIMLVTDERDRVLLGRQPSWPAGRYSALAGFVEPGESLEAAVAREVMEESGVAVADVLYASSQPWPFPASLMLGFMARHAGGEPRAVDGELEDVRWFGRDEVQAAVAGAGPLHLPPRVAIARRLLDAWLG